MAGKRVLVFCLPGIGDSLLATPALRALKRDWPDCDITALTMFQGAKELLERFSFIDRVVHFDLPKEGAARSLRFALGLRRERFDISLLTYPANRLEYNLLAVLCGARLRVGHHYRHLDFAGGHWMNHRSVLEENALSNIEENLRLVTLLTGNTTADHAVDLPLQEEEEFFARRWLEERGLCGRRLIGLHPGGSTAKNHLHKRWPEDRYAALGKRLSETLGAAILLFGGAEESPMKRRIAGFIGSDAYLVEAPHFLQTAALLAQCHHFVSNDNALAHVAGALKIPSTILFGPTHEGWVRIPGVPRHEMLSPLDCRPCFYYSPRHLCCPSGDFSCLKAITVENVAEQICGVFPEPGFLHVEQAV